MRTPLIEEDRLVDPVDESKENNELLESVQSLPADKISSVPKGMSSYDQFLKWKDAEDAVGLLIALVLFFGTLIISRIGYDLSTDYSTSSQWPLGGILVSLLVIGTAQYCLRKPFDGYQGYCAAILIAVVSRSIGNYPVLSHAGLSASLWAILIGTCIRSCGVVFGFGKALFNGEFFVKIGVTLLAMDFTSIATIGLRGLAVAWVDTILVLMVGIFIASNLMGLERKDAIVVTGATSICGTSAAKALSSSIHGSQYVDDVCKTIIAIMSVANAPLMPILPIFKTVIGLNSAVVGAWIGGSIDSTGQVTASAQMGGDQVLRTAVIIKMAQNILIGKR